MEVGMLLEARVQPQHFLGPLYQHLEPPIIMLQILQIHLEIRQVRFCLTILRDSLNHMHLSFSINLYMIPLVSGGQVCQSKVASEIQNNNPNIVLLQSKRTY